MAKHSSPIKPRLLGAIGKDHFAAKLSGLGVAHETFHYQRAEFEHGDLPYLVGAMVAARIRFGSLQTSIRRHPVVSGRPNGESARARLCSW
jgi:hypothetical protein